MNIELLRQFGQRLLPPYGSQGHLRFESRRVVPAWLSAHRLSCSAAILAAVRQKRHLSHLFRNPEPALLRGVEVHVTSHEGGTAQMRPVEGGVEIKPGETVRLAPGGRHLMFIGLKQSLSEGEQVEGTLQFKNAGSVPVKFEVQAAAARAPAN